MIRPACYICLQELPESFTFTKGEPPPRDAWYWTNVTPDASPPPFGSGPVMRPVHDRCKPLPTLVASARTVAGDRGAQGLAE